MFVADSMRFLRAPTTSIDSVNSAQMIDKIEVLIRVRNMMMVVMQSTFCPVVIFGEMRSEVKYYFADFFRNFDFNADEKR